MIAGSLQKGLQSCKCKMVKAKPSKPKGQREKSVDSVIFGDADFSKVANMAAKNGSIWEWKTPFDNDFVKVEIYGFMWLLL